uniref:roundabout homolog 2-like n=1 Tax=Styela clava TaxID=7725 RepID=UPI00193978F2|nr:roundabout homolog 2-like [Styela clava]
MGSIVKSIAMLDMNSRMEYFQIILFTLIYIGIHEAFSEKILDVEISPKKVIVTPSYEDPIVLRCTIKSSANISDGEDLKSYWTKNGVPITERLVNTTIFDDDKLAAPYLLENDTLFIGRLSPEKEGTYACTARIRTFSEIVSEERSTAPVYFAKVNDFSFVSPDTEVEEGSFATLTCVSGFSIPSANLSWIKAGGGKITGVQSQYILRHDKETGMYMTSSSIQFSNISTYDQGEYSCVAVNRLLPSLTKVSRRIFLRVKEKPAAPQIILQPESVYAVNDQSSKFVCISSGTPTPKITWYYNNVNIDAGQSPVQDAISIDSYGHTSILAISSSTPEVTGEYKCLAKNEFGHAMSKAAELQIAAFSWIFEQEPEYTEIYINKAATLICRPPSSQPPASITWYKDNKVLDLTRTPSVRKLSSGDLYLEEVKLEHSGEYFCQASNRLLDVTATSQRAQVTVFAPPTVTQLPITADVVLEHTIKLECNVTGYPFPDVKWTKNGLTLATNERIILGLRNQTLFITSAMTEDEAFYSCTARNEHGRIDSGPTLLKVLVPPVIHTKVPDNVLIDLGVPYTISCKAIGTPEPKYKWTKDGRFLNVSAESRLTLVNNGLKISEVLESDTGRTIVQHTTKSPKFGLMASSELKFRRKLLLHPRAAQLTNMGI